MYQSAKLKIKFLLSILICFNISQVAVAQAQNINTTSWSCAKNVPGFPYNLEKISGIWYEAARMPTSQVPACVQVTVPNATTEHDDGDLGAADNTTTKLNLRLDYVNNVNNKWRPTTENLQFPWNVATKNGIFRIKYGNDVVNMNFTFKMVFSDYTNITIICYYTNYIPSLSMIKIMTRKQQLDEATKNTLQDFADLQGLGEQFTWVEQSGRCNKAQNVIPTTFLLLFLAVFVRQTYLN